ncbi:hypothetical protein [Gordonia hydrophobica]|uniref:Uncharacterized protein n=1 Tax=Gordonia hydrophobica TaxID=40516 RepID=A0ABZ2U5N4_9ACTN|nr:hypothetical protein [Gordonia hydrophobica]MBM7368750.1 hypothetical protein [Gordonia hydrophobica]
MRNGARSVVVTVFAIIAIVTSLSSVRFYLSDRAEYRDCLTALDRARRRGRHAA